MMAVRKEIAGDRSIFIHYKAYDQIPKCEAEKSSI